jgi:nitrogen regulatory protein P-II 1
MKKLEAIIKPFKLREVQDALADLGIDGITLTEVKGFGHDTVHREMYRDSIYQVDFLPRFKVEVVVSDEMLATAIAAVARSARTGKTGDGKLFVTPVEQAFLICAEETGLQAVG